MSEPCKRAPVSERRDDESVGTAEELILVDAVPVGDADDAEVGVVLEVEAGLLEPLEVAYRLDVHATLKHVTSSPHIILKIFCQSNCISRKP